MNIHPVLWFLSWLVFHLSLSLSSLLHARDHSSDASALAQVLGKNASLFHCWIDLNMVAERAAVGMGRAHETSEDEAKERFEKWLASAGEFPGSSEVDTDVSDRSESTPPWRSNRGLSNKNERTVVCVEKRGCNEQKLDRRRS